MANIKSSWQSLTADEPRTLYRAPEEAAEAAGTSDTVCRLCRQHNDAGRRFCGRCGRALWETCPQCQKPGPVGEAFCGECGTNLAGLHQKRIKEYESATKQARELQADHRFDEAAALLEPLTNETHPLLEVQVATCRTLLSEISRHKEGSAANAQTAIEHAREYTAAGTYRLAADVLAAIPAPMRSGEIDRLLQEVCAKRDEVAKLENEIRAAVESKKIAGLLPKVLRLMELQPGNENIKRLAGQIAQRMIREAAARLKASDYATALKTLRQVPQQWHNDLTRKLFAQAAEATWLLDDVRQSPVIDETLIAIVQRLAKLSPDDPQLTKMRADMSKKAAAGSSDRRFPLVPWATRSKRPLVLGAPVRYLGGLERIIDWQERIPPELAPHGSSFFVACGMALQLLGRATLDWNLLSSARKKGLAGLAQGLRRPPRTAWGIDVGAGALHAVKLAWDEKTDRAVALEVARIEYQPSPSGTGAAAERDAEQRIAALETALGELVERYQASGERVAVAVPGYQTLSRFIDLPGVVGRKVAAIMEYEATHQIPFPLDEVFWDYALLGETEKGKDQTATRLPAVILAAKKQYVISVTAAFEGAGWHVDMVQSSCGALYNLLAYEFFGTTESGDAPEEGDAPLLALVDVGRESTDVVVGSARLAWFRSFGLGGDDFTRALVRPFKLSWDQAEQLKCNPQQASQLNRMYRALDRPLRTLIEEVERSLSAGTRFVGASKVATILGVGGGFQMHGVHRCLQSGPIGDASVE
jgi:type IV pilus assembly protein PilM